MCEIDKHAVKLTDIYVKILHSCKKNILLKISSLNNNSTVSLQIHGDSSMHAEVRRHCLNFMVSVCVVMRRGLRGNDGKITLHV